MYEKEGRDFFLVVPLGAIKKTKTKLFFLRVFQIFCNVHLLEAGGKPSTWLPPGELVEQHSRQQYFLTETFMFLNLYDFVIIV